MKVSTSITGKLEATDGFKHVELNVSEESQAMLLMEQVYVCTSRQDGAVKKKNVNGVMYYSAYGNKTGWSKWEAGEDTADKFTVSVPYEKSDFDRFVARRTQLL